jgi:hypothetical protein
MGAMLFLVCGERTSAATYINGFDVYSGDGTVNWTSAKNGGYQFAYVKATEGVDFIDSRFTTNMNGAHNAGVLVGPYHFTRIESKNGVKFTSYDEAHFRLDRIRISMQPAKRPTSFNRFGLSTHREVIYHRSPTWRRIQISAPPR